MILSIQGLMFRGEVIQDTGFQVLGHILGINAQPVKQAQLTSISVKVYDSLDISSAVVDTTLTISDVIFDTLQSDNRWCYEDGYNFLHKVSAAYTPNGWRTYKYFYTFNPTTGDDWKVLGEVDSIAAIG